MKGHDTLKSHPFFAGVNWEGVKNQTEPVPAYNIVYDQADPNKVISFSLVPPECTCGDSQNGISFASRSYRFGDG